MIKFLFNNKVIKFFYGVLFLPLCYSIFVTLLFIIRNVDFNHKLIKSFLIGCLSYIFLHIFLYRPIKIYIIGHELMHALSAFLCGAKVKNIKFSKTYGSVNINKVNTFIALSPYLFPLSSIIIIFLWFILKFLLKVEIKPEIFIFFLGFSFAFHLVLTTYAVFIGQQDFKISGWLFSVVLIFFVNNFFLILFFLILLYKNINFNLVKNYFFDSSYQSYKYTFNILIILWNNIKNKIFY